jgi:radical SAM superfamily enzyme YgiQ (UPF0313 family)
MAHAIIFVDRAPRTRALDLTSLHYTHFAGAAKIASELRKDGKDVLIVPNCMNLSFAGIKQIIENNRENLLWVGLSTTLMAMRVTEQDREEYYNIWSKSADPIMDIDFLVKKVNDTLAIDVILWNKKALGRISHLLESKYKVPFIIGGGYVSSIDTTGPLVHPNMHVVQGYAESYTKELTQAMSVSPRQDVPYVVNNAVYDNTEFKDSQIYWTDTDLIEPNDWLPIEVARGCAFNCAYCNYPRRGEFDSYRHAESMREELIRNYEKYGVTKYMLVDDLYNDSKDKVRYLYDNVWSRLPFKPEWTSFMRLDMFWADPESAEIVKASGARYGGFGIETLHDQAGKRIGKGLGKKRIIETLIMLKKVWGNQVLVGANMIAGLPFEPIESINESIDWTMTTDLIHGATWQHLGLIPPDIKIVANSKLQPEPKNRIDSDFDKFGVKWLDGKNWINSAGVTNSQSIEIVQRYKPNNPWAGRFNQYLYADIRSAGVTHEQIANVRTGGITEEIMAESMRLTKHRINQRLNKLLKITDKQPVL